MSARKCISEDRLIDFATGGVGGDEARGIEEHLKVCPHCRAQVESLKRTLDIAAIDRVPEPEPAYWEHFAGNVRHRIRDRAESRKRRFRLVLIPGLATAAACVLLIVVLTRIQVEQVGDVENIIAELNASVVTEEVLLESGVDALLLGQFGTDANLLDEYLNETGDLGEMVGELNDDEERELINRLNSLMELRGNAESRARKEC
ncbi:MAG: zf-HC2 domain-containing protein [bacterium]